MIKKNLDENIEEIKGISERIAVLNIKLPTHRKEDKDWTIIQAYSPTESHKKEDMIKIENFYEELRTTIENAHKNVIVMGDFNGQIGTQDRGEEYTIGKHGLGTRSKNGTRLVNFALENKLSILNSFYKKKPTRKWTWISPNGNYKNEIDYILSNNKKVFKDVSVINNFNFNTDHRMVRATLSVIHCKKSRKFHNHIMNTGLECTGNVESLLSNLSLALENDKGKYVSIQEKYDRLLNQLKTVTKRINSNNKGKISDLSRQLIQQRKELLQERINSKDKRLMISEISKNIYEQLRKDRKKHRFDTLKKHIERTGGIKKARKELNCKKEWIQNMKNKDGKTTANRPEILKTATDYYRELYKSKDTDPEIKEYTRAETEIIPIILPEETTKAINTQKLDKAPGSDLVTNELLKSTAPVLIPRLTDLFNDIIKTEVIPDDWTKSSIILLHKKGDKGNIANYRPISLMSNIYKIFSKIILSRITNTLEENQPKEQAGFRNNFSTIDHIHTLQQVIQKYKEYNKTYYLAYVDFKKAFDTLEHRYIWNALKTQGVPNKYITLLKNIYTKSTAHVKLEYAGQEFPIERGVRQGDPISPKLFSAVLESIFRRLEWTQLGLNINGETLNHLRFADDLILFSDSPKTLQLMLQQLAHESAKAGLTMNSNKTKIMTNSSQTYTITVNNEQIEYVQEYIYLGQLISNEFCMHKEITRRVNNTWKKFWSLSEIMKSKDMPMKEKRKIFNVCILPCLLYGCQTWTLTGQLANKIKVCQNSIERSVIGVKRRDRVKLEEIKSKTKFTNAYTMYKQLKWRWTGHMMRERKEKWTTQITEWYPRDGKRKRGRQNKRWDDEIKNVAGPLWTRTAKDRNLWKFLEEAFVRGQAVKYQ